MIAWALARAGDVRQIAFTQADWCTGYFSRYIGEEVTQYALAIITAVSPAAPIECRLRVARRSTPRYSISSRCVRCRARRLLYGAIPALPRWAGDSFPLCDDVAATSVAPRLFRQVFQLTTTFSTIGPEAYRVFHCHLTAARVWPGTTAFVAADMLIGGIAVLARQ